MQNNDLALSCYNILGLLLIGYFDKHHTIKFIGQIEYHGKGFKRICECECCNLGIKYALHILPLIH